MTLGQIGHLNDIPAAWSAILFLAALGSVAGGFLVCARSATLSDAIVRSLLGPPRPEQRPLRDLSEFSKLLGRGCLKAWFVGAVMMGGLAVYLKHDGLGEILLYAVLGGGGGELCHRGQSERKRRELARRLEFHLPTAMERVVMAVGAGFDIVPALSEAARKSEDPVSDLLRAIVALSEGGLRVEHAVHMTADSVSSLPVKHAFIHLALAYRQGGEIVRPLKELSDATQTQWQEGVEEEIAKLPVRAVIPLLMTFAGLIICFLTVPVVQVGASLERFEHAAN